MLPLRNSFRIISLCCLLAAGLLIGGCSGGDDNPTNSDPNNALLGTAKLTAVLVSPYVSASEKEDARSAGSGVGATVDSIYVTKVTSLLARTLLRRDQFNSSAGADNVRNSNRVVEAQWGEPIWYAEGAVSNGTYTHLEFNVSRLAPGGAADPYFEPFQVEGYPSVIVEGRYYRDGEVTEFTLHCEAIPSVKVTMDPPVVIAAGSVHTIMLSIDPAKLFKRNGAILDPTDAANKSEIESGIKEMFVAAGER